MADFSLKAIFGMDATGVRTELRQLRKDMNSFVDDYAKLGAGMVVGAFAALSKGAMETAERLRDTSLNIGLNVVSLQALEAQHGRNGVKSAELEKALLKTKAAVLDTASGGDKARAAFGLLGLSAEKLVKLPLDKQYAEVAKAIAKAKNESAAYAAAGQIFGEEIGPKLFNSLKELGSVGLPGVAKSAREAGQVMSGETIAALNRAGDAIEDFKKKATVWAANIVVNFNSAEGLKLLGMQILKVLGQFGGGILDAIIDADRMIGAVLRGSFIGVVNLFRDGLIDAAKWAGEAVNRILPTRFQIDLGGLDSLKSAGRSVALEIATAIDQTEPSNLRKAIGDSWDDSIKKQQKVVDALNKKDFGEDAKKLEDAGKKIGESIKSAGKTVAEAVIVVADSATEAWNAALEAAALAARAARDFRDVQIAISRKGLDYESQTTEALQGVRDRLNSQVQQMENDTSHQSTWSPNAKNPLYYGLTAELEAVNRELKTRAEIGRYAAQNGEDAARYRYGDTLTNRAIQNMSEDSTRTAVAVEGINQRLARIFGR